MEIPQFHTDELSIRSTYMNAMPQTSLPPLPQSPQEKEKKKKKKKKRQFAVLQIANKTREFIAVLSLDSRPVRTLTSSPGAQVEECVYRAGRLNPAAASCPRVMAIPAWAMARSNGGGGPKMRPSCLRGHFEIIAQRRFSLGRLER
ncbi:hypothetical protein ACO22_04023 [Paracoccidioides brasiliensis]|uniref:Uncharacterized protein n=1 Tax=Paracoccidioides brasiliensis TaxID=121759 RepID=A0A1D2JE74_PARBR|nr:hypothetical protein ACO22_04023 [Paracoccidioides brasiliensis]